MYRMRSKFKLKEERVEKFFHSYGMFLSEMGEIRIDKEKIIQDAGIKFGLADVSLLKAYGKRFFHKKSSKNCPSGGAGDILFRKWEWCDDFFKRWTVLPVL